jgi:hypothetical protein
MLRDRNRVGTTIVADWHAGIPGRANIRLVVTGAKQLDQFQIWPDLEQIAIDQAIDEPHQKFCVAHRRFVLGTSRWHHSQFNARGRHFPCRIGGIWKVCYKNDLGTHLTPPNSVVGNMALCREIDSQSATNLLPPIELSGLPICKVRQPFSRRLAQKKTTGGQTLTVKNGSRMNNHRSSKKHLRRPNNFSTNAHYLQCVRPILNRRKVDPLRHCPAHHFSSQIVEAPARSIEQRMDAIYAFLRGIYHRHKII